MKKFFKEFKAFISKGNVLDLAVGVCMGTAFNAIVNSLVKSIIMPLICAIFGAASVSELAFTLNGTEIPYGVFLQAIIDFLLIAFSLFVVLKIVMGAKGYTTKLVKDKPTKAEKKELKEMGVDMKNRKVVLAETKKLRESKVVVTAPKPTSEQLLESILEELKKSNAPKTKETKKEEKESAEISE